MRLVDDLNRFSKDAFTNAAISALCALWWGIILVERDRTPDAKPPVIAWLALGAFALGTIYMLTRGYQLRRAERNSERKQDAA